jgi:hypothetical protein
MAQATIKFEMRQLAEDTGGRTFPTIEPAGLADVYEQIGNELRAQYWLAYAAGLAALDTAACRFA